MVSRSPGRKTALESKRANQLLLAEVCNRCVPVFACRKLKDRNGAFSAGRPPAVADRSWLANSRELVSSADFPGRLRSFQGRTRRAKMYPD